MNAPKARQMSLKLESFPSRELSIQMEQPVRYINIHRKKWFAIFLSPGGMSLTKLSLAGNNLIIPSQVEFG
jgi:hypothetical protein